MSSGKWRPFCFGLIVLNKHPGGWWSETPWCHSRDIDVRLLHGPILLAIGLSMGYEKWPPIGWRHDFVIGRSKYRLGLPSSRLHYGLTWSVWIPNVFQTPVTGPSHSPSGRQMQMPTLRVLQWGLWKSLHRRIGNELLQYFCPIQRRVFFLFISICAHMRCLHNQLSPLCSKLICFVDNIFIPFYIPLY